jgi:TolB-like protein/DNA-binding winged helix-turn-helix (wHTH) protein
VASPLSDLTLAPDFRLGSAHVRPSTCEVAGAGGATRLQPRVMQVLVALARAPGHVVSRKSLVEACWGDVVVGDDALNRCVQRLRLLSQEEASGAFVIETIPRLGYRLSASETAMLTGPPDPATPDAASSVPAEASSAARPDEGKEGARETGDDASGSPRFRTDRRMALIGGGALASAVAATASWAWWRRGQFSPLSDKSIVVLPFANLSGDPGQAYFSDGVTEEVRDALTRIQGLRVIGRMSSAQVRDMGLKEIGAKLGVGAILTGSVRRSLKVIRVSAQLVDAARGDERWSEDFDRASGDLMPIEDDIARGVASAVDARIGADETFVGTRDPQAQDLYLKARTLDWGSSTVATMGQALQLIDAALKVDPRYVRAHTARAVLLGNLASAESNAADRLRLLAEAERFARRAVTLAPQWSYGHVELAGALMDQLDFRGALDQYRNARQLDPNHRDSTFPMFLASIGRGNAAMAAQSVEVSRDPLNPWTSLDQGYTAYFTRRYEDALALARQTLAWAPKVLPLKFLAAKALLCLDRPREAFDLIPAWADDSRSPAFIQAIASWRLGDRRGSDEALAQLKQLPGDTVDVWLAEILAQRGEIEAALASLDAAWRVRDSELIALASEPMLDPLRSEPRFKALLAKLDFP